MIDANRPWWADRAAVEAYVEQRVHDATLDYLGGLVAAIEHRIAYVADDPAEAASSALAALDALTDGNRLTIGRMPLDATGGPQLVLTLGTDGITAELTGGRPEPMPFQVGDPAHVMVCTCSHAYTDHSDVGCSWCWHCASFKYSHDDDGKV
ncbi:hypothetical protein SEA_LEMOND_58 [Mycobacterium phage LeMond]|uniref:Uncharacterized protein n=1 Tax=Mycobacterium phage KiSi TaxID=2507856 RepID=A0A410TBQ6_9CAUD|nr:hypothetical protein I5G98_gp050 [Mycobacterium phage KiSi]AYR01123.1 hypothetical protein SEA_LEMOND_58 [Mycobacterium phage LeMond]AYR01658.1 hypothetical protein SEA_SCARLETT_58 [Mycobacterium phage Scarlett]QAU06476.1 hypothetical protein SEA_KISI_58 [Mycobacterium phage KiSi]